MQKYAAALREAAGGGAHLAFDMVGQARDPNATLAALHSLRRGGRLVLMGSMATELPIPYGSVMLNNWEILGQFMYPASAYRRLLDLLRSGMLYISAMPPARLSARGLAGSDGGRFPSRQSRMHRDAASGARRRFLIG